MRLIDADKLLTSHAEHMVGKYAFDLMQCLIEDTPTLTLEEGTVDDGGIWRYTFDRSAMVETPKFMTESELAELIDQFGAVKLERVFKSSKQISKRERRLNG